MLARHRRARPHAHHQRLAPREARRAALKAAGPEARHRQPRLARRRRLPRDERRRLPGREGARRHRRRGGGGPRAGQDQHGGEARRERRRASCRWRARFRGTRPHPALHRVHGRRQHQRLAHGRRRARARDRATRSARAAARAGRRELRRRGRRALALPRRRAARSASSPRSRRRSAATARARASRPTASSTPACSRSRGHDLRSLLRAGASDDEIARRDRARSGSARADRYSEIRTAADGEVAESRDVATSAAERWPPPELTDAAPPARPSRSRRYNERGEMVPTPIAGEHPLTLYVDKREIVTLMTLGQRARGARHRLPAQPAPGATRSTTSPRCRSTGKPTRSRSPRARRLAGPRREDGEAHRHHRLRPGHGVRRPDGGDRQHPAARRRDARPRRRCYGCSTRCASTRRSTSRPARCTAARSPPPPARS